MDNETKEMMRDVKEIQEGVEAMRIWFEGETPTFEARAAFVTAWCWAQDKKELVGRLLEAFDHS